MKKKLILYINPNQFGYSAGHYFYCKYLLNDYDIDYLCFDRGLPKISLNGLNIFYLPVKSYRLINLLHFIYYSVITSYKNKYDFIIAVRFKFVFLLGLFGRSSQKIIDIRSISLSDYRFKRQIDNFLTRINTLPFDKIITLSESISNALRLNKIKTFIVPLGAERFSENYKYYDDFFLLYVGSLHKRRIEDTIVAISKFYREYNNKINIKYDIVGFGPNEKSIIDLIQKENACHYITFHGRKNYHELKYFFERSNIGVCYIPVNDYYDVQPATKLFEYVLSGLFTIATNTFENRKFITPDNGILCDDNPDSFYGKLVELYFKRNKLDFYIIRNSLDDYSWENIVNNQLKLVLSEVIK